MTGWTRGGVAGAAGMWRRWSRWSGITRSGWTAMRVCLEPGCPTLTDRTRCAEHGRAKDKARGTSTARGYGADHRRERDRWAPLVATGNVKCARCADYIAPDAPWDLDHHDRDRSRYLGPSHASCNRAAPR